MGGNWESLGNAGADQRLDLAVGAADDVRGVGLDRQFVAAREEVEREIPRGAGDLLRQRRALAGRVVHAVIPPSLAVRTAPSRRRPTFAPGVSAWAVIGAETSRSPKPVVTTYSMRLPR